ncbi:MAG TPA: DUF92 domain-containing protein [Anaerolineae bacterium]|jgi:uncharacterized protein (TIGR00297 family)|nr:DUF92 domain-containing protein [Ardenticatenia bacterium]HRA19665.1 DUF92 domain-containing protein [Anaerolineae bacterium]
MPPLVPLPAILLSLALAALVAGGGYRARALSGSGAAAAMVVGALVFGLGGAVWGLLLVFFFVSSSALSLWRAEDKREAEGRSSKDSRRDWGQVLANGGLGAVLALLQAVGRAGWLPWLAEVDLLPAFAGLMAAVTADTWATELGLLSPTPPRLITTGEEVAPGTSGGVTALGLTAAAAGGLVIGLVAVLGSIVSQLVALRSLDLALVDTMALARLAFISPLVGLASAAADSLLGATAQAMFKDPRGGQTERASGVRGQHVLLRGRRWMTNDRVNFLAGLLGALLALGLDRLLV